MLTLCWYLEDARNDFREANQMDGKFQLLFDMCVRSYNTIPYHTIKYNTIRYNTIQYNTNRRVRECDLCRLDVFINVEGCKLSAAEYRANASQ